MKLIVNITAHGIQQGEYKGDTLSKLLQDKRNAVTTLVSRGQAHWDHEDPKPVTGAPAATPPAKTDKPAD